MNVRQLKHHPGHYLRADAADAFDAMEDKYGPIVLNRAGVPVEVQQGLIDRWNKGGAANRPPFLFEPKRPAEASEHVQYVAVDVYNYTSDRHKLNEFGFKWYGPKDPVHYTFTGWKSDYTAKPNTKETEDMDFINIQGNTGENHAGVFAIYRANSTGVLYAKRITTGTTLPNLPTFDKAGLAELKQIMPFINL